MISTQFKELQRELGISDLAATFADISHMIASGSNSVDVFTLLTQRIVEILPVQASGILLIDVNHVLQVVGSSDHSAHLLDLYQVQNQSGPCLESCSTGQLVMDTELTPTGAWPEFAALAKELNFSAVYAIPLVAGEKVFGALNLFCANALAQRDVTLTRALADVATLALLQADPLNDATIVTRNLQMSISSRNVIEQAKGVLSQRFTIDMNEAFRRIENVALQHGIGIVHLARSITERTLSDNIAESLNNA